MGSLPPRQELVTIQFGCPNRKNFRKIVENARLESLVVAHEPWNVLFIGRIR